MPQLSAASSGQRCSARPHMQREVCHNLHPSHNGAHFSATRQQLCLVRSIPNVKDPGTRRPLYSRPTGRMGRDAATSDTYREQLDQYSDAGPAGGASPAPLVPYRLLQLSPLERSRYYNFGDALLSDSVQIVRTAVLVIALIRPVSTLSMAHMQANQCRTSQHCPVPAGAGAGSGSGSVL